MTSIFIKIPISERLPEDKHFMHPEGKVAFMDQDMYEHQTLSQGMMVDLIHRGLLEERYDYWLEEVQLPTDEEIASFSEKRLEKACISDPNEKWLREHDFEMGAKWLVDHIKKGGAE